MFVGFSFFFYFLAGQTQQPSRLRSLKKSKPVGSMKKRPANRSTSNRPGPFRKWIQLQTAALPLRGSACRTVPSPPARRCGTGAPPCATGLAASATAGWYNHRRQVNELKLHAQKGFEEITRASLVCEKSISVKEI